LTSFITCSKYCFISSSVRESDFSLLYHYLLIPFGKGDYLAVVCLCSSENSFALIYLQVFPTIVLIFSVSILVLPEISSSESMPTIAVFGS
jgi:hypothetical protein